MSLIQKQKKCPNCGYLQLEMIGPSEMKCPACGTLYSCPVEKNVPKLIMKKGKTDSLLFSICSSKIIGRGEKGCLDSELGYVKIMGENCGSPEENTRVRNPFVSHQHAKIIVREELIGEMQGEKLGTLYTKRICFIEDLNSTYGTAVNDRLLCSREQVQLRHNDKITLGAIPEAQESTIFIFKEE